MTSIRRMPWLLSSWSSTASGDTGSKKLGHPEPDSNFVSRLEERRAARGAVIHAVGMVVYKSAREGTFGALFAKDVELFRR